MVDEDIKNSKTEDKTFHPEHLADLKKSGLNDKTINLMGAYSVRPADINKVLGWNPPNVTSVYGMPYEGTNGFCRYKLFPSFKNKQGHTVKYWQKKNTSSRLYILSPVREVLADTSVPLIIAEGEKKTAALVQAGGKAIGVGGVWCWKDSKTKKAIRDFDIIAWKRRQVLLCFDSDAWSRPDLLKALYELGKELEGRGALVQALVLESIGHEKVGIDDFLVANGAQALQTLKKIPLTDEVFNFGLRGFGLTPIGKIKTKRLSWLIKNILPAGVLAFISAMPKAGKTTFAMYLVLCLTTGRKFLNHYPLGRKKPYRVIYISLEDFSGEFKVKIKYFLNGSRFPRNFQLLDANSINLPTDFDKLKIDLGNFKPDAVVLDTLRRSHSIEEDSASAMAPILNGMRALVREFNFTSIVIHHAGHKVGDKTRQGDWLRGSSDINASWETLITLDKEHDIVKTRVFHKYRSDLEFKYRVLKGLEIDHITGDCPIVDLDYMPPDDSEYKQIEEKILKALVDNPQSGNHLQETTGIPRDRLDEVLSRLSSKGKVKQSGNGRNKKWFLVT